ncbi:hypothetical protein CEUSTIGMA_g10724.t1 [Chlamydomonas eustigma]|uniref:Uncharacterized protein n=1 Tax=Chlamydomonas eustigma TaxID=1157962 RepID=A0A250XJQ7_9CHLO|nr:hypothetical protein CEUSTIGMA_g10724.t1 [Chlamydomonas eustigma]|eukprot:GAX83298.1 hypothetical protein CEUSTIGMA_g10724.t1 [Chlamydomonas eustigma]
MEVVNGSSIQILDHLKPLLQDINENGVSGLMEHGEYVTSLIQGTKPCSSSVLLQLIDALEDAAELLITEEEESTFGAIMVLMQLRKDVVVASSICSSQQHQQGEGDSPVMMAQRWTALSMKLKAALISALNGYGREGTEEGRIKGGNLQHSASLLAIMVHPTLLKSGETDVQLMCEASMLHMLERSAQCVEYMRGEDLFQSLLLKRLKVTISNASNKASGIRDDEQDDDDDEVEVEAEEEGEEEEGIEEVDDEQVDVDRKRVASVKKSGSKDNGTSGSKRHRS